MLKTLKLDDLHQDILNIDANYNNNLKKINILNNKGINIQKKKIKGAIIINNGYYGKCITPDCNLNIYIDNENENINIYNCWKKYSLTENYDYDGLGYWTYPKKNIFIESIDCNKKIVRRKIRIFYRQKIKELIREIELENGLKISITNNHRLLKRNNEKYQWEYELNVNDVVCFNNDNKISYSYIKNIKQYLYDGFVYDISISGTKNYIANNILCHNTSRNILSYVINLNKCNLIICEKWRKQYFNNLLDNKTTSNINYIDNKKIYYNSEIYENIIFDIDLDNIKKYESVGIFFSKYKYKKIWIILNNYKYNNNYKILENILSLYSNSILLGDDIKKLYIKNEIYIKKKINYQIRKLKFNKDERRNYELYLNKFNKIYEDININFENDEYLRKYCCFPHKNLDINYFNINLIKSMNIKEEFKNNFIIDLNDTINKNVNCLICFNDITNNNLGITNCGHIFCYSCLYKSVNINNKCPKCRNNISDTSIYLYDPDVNRLNNNILKIKNKDDKSYVKKSKTNKLTYQLECELMDSLGTKFSYLIKMIRNLKYVLIISNYDYNLIYINKILKQLNLESQIVNNKKIIEEDRSKILLINYNNNFNKIEYKSYINTIILNEPYYYKNDIDKKEKYASILNCINKKVDLFSLVIENTIEEKFLFNVT